MNTKVHLVGAVTTLLFLSACGTVSTPTEPAVETQAATGTVAKGHTINLRSGPGTNYRVVGQKTGGQKVKIVCHARGTRHKGPWGYSRLWDKLASGKWISDAYVYTGSMKRVAPWCKGHKPSPTQGRIIGDNYPYKNGSTSGVDRWNFYIRQCVSFAAWRIRKVKNVKFDNYFRGVHWGNANNWDDAARAAGVKVSRTPKVGDIAHWEAYQRNALEYGHVAYVAKVHGNGDITVEEYNWKPYTYGTRRISAAGLSFIRF